MGFIINNFWGKNFPFYGELLDAVKFYMSLMNFFENGYFFIWGNMFAIVDVFCLLCYLIIIVGIE